MRPADGYDRNGLLVANVKFSFIEVRPCEWTVLDARIDRLATQAKGRRTA